MRRAGVRPAIRSSAAWRRGTQARLRAILLPKERPGGGAGLRVLDYGCGAGSLLRVARQFGMSGAGIEPDQQARRTARNLAGAEVYASAEQLLSARASASFDLIILWTVIEHLRWPWQDLARLGAMLSEGGRLLV